VSASGPSAAPSGLQALRIPYVRSFALGRVASNIGAQIVTVAVGWELYERTNDPWALGLVGLVTLAPGILLMLPAGNAADRFPRRNIAMLACLLTGLASFGLAAVSWLNGPVEAIFAMLVVIGAARTISAPASGTILPQLIEPRQFANVNAWLISTQQLSSIGGPAVGGFLIALTGEATSSYVIAAIAQFLFAGILATFPAVAPPPGAKRDLSDIFAGFAFIWRTPIFLAAITLDLFAVLLGGAVALLPVFARDILQVGPEGLGLMRAAPGVGALVAALLATRLPPWRAPGQVLMLMVVGFGAATIGFGLSRVMWLSLICLFFTGAFDSISMVIRQTLMQTLTPDRLRGRVASVNYLFVGFSNELGAFESGATAALFGPILSVVGGGIGTILVVTTVWLKWPVLANIAPLHTLRPASADPRRAPEPAREPAQA
jgi:MFS family permease